MEAEILKNGKIAGTRSSVYDVVMYLEGGWQSLNEIAEILRITPAQVRAAVDYIDGHRDEVMAVHKEIEERNARGNPPEVEAKLVITRAKMQAWLKERHGLDDHSGLISF
jgi:uncharacterized protein (DUF433 family)